MQFLKSKHLPLLAALWLAACATFSVVRSAHAQDFEEYGEYEEWGEPEFWLETPPTRVWGGVDYLLWWRRGMQTPPLVTTGATGVLGDPGTLTLFGGALPERARSGGKVNLGMWCDPCETIGMGVSFFALGQQTNVFQLDSTVMPLIGVPFFDVNAGQEDALLLASPGPPLVNGGINIRTNSDVLGGDIYARGNFLRDRGIKCDWLVGYQAARIDEDLLINYNLNDGVNTFTFLDQFSTKNQYNAASLGLSGEGRNGRFTWSGLAKIGLGNMRQTVTISGQNTVTPGPITTAGGFFAQGTNSGTFARNQFAAAPELGLKFGYDMTPSARVSVGYNYLYFSKVAQPGDQIDRNINDTQLNGGALVGAAQPAFAFVDRGYWMHGLTLGVDWRF